MHYRQWRETKMKKKGSKKTVSKIYRKGRRGKGLIRE